ncbi:hypothetical protein ANANG_G00241360, partial [Anguilla anguilla]
EEVSLSRRGLGHLPPRWEGHVVGDLVGGLAQVLGRARRAEAGQGPGRAHGGQLERGGRGVCPHVLGAGAGGARRLSYLSGVGLWFRRFEKGIGQFSHPHGYRRWYDCIFRVHYSIKKSFQVGLRVTSDMNDLVPGRGVMLARIHGSELGEKLCLVFEK